MSGHKVRGTVGMSDSFLNRILCLQVSRVKVQLVDSGGGLVQPQVYLRLHCLDSGFPFKDYYMIYIHQTPEKGPERVC
jgi:hypothetical protein